MRWWRWAQGRGVTPRKWKRQFPGNSWNMPYALDGSICCGCWEWGGEQARNHLGMCISATDWWGTLGQNRGIRAFNNTREQRRHGNPPLANSTLHVHVINSCGEGLVNNSLMPNGYQWDQTMHLADIGRSIHYCTRNKGECATTPWTPGRALALAQESGCNPVQQGPRMYTYAHNYMAWT